MQMNYYAILGIPEDADEETTRRAFRLLARRYHPDAGAGSSPEKFRQIVEAYETLRDPARRAAYDVALGRARRKTARTPVEPLRPEPLIPPRAAEMAWPVGRRFSRHVVFPDSVFFKTPAIDELFDLMFRAFDDGLFPF
jgi:curved DNA-binding protein CbpA